MMGKILGIASVALTQLLIWVVFIAVAGGAAINYFAGDAMAAAAAMNAGTAGMPAAMGDIGTDVLKLDLCSAEMQNRTNALPGIFVQARTLRLNLLAEGIESAEQLNVLRKAGCTEGQGYFFSRPLSVDEFAKILKVGHAG